MTIDWITVAAQIANFLVLVWLLKRFLYRPILDGIDAREAEISERLNNAVQARQSAQKAEQAFNEKLASLQADQADLQSDLRAAAEAEKDALLDTARARIAQEQAHWHAERGTAARTYAAKLHKAGAGALLELTRKALDDLADDTFDARAAGRLIDQLPGMADDVKAAAGQAKTAQVISHAALPGAVQDQLRDALSAMFPQMDTRFTTDPDQAPGLVLRIGGAELAWTLASYIEGLDQLALEGVTHGDDTKPRADDD